MKFLALVFVTAAVVVLSAAATSLVLSTCMHTSLVWKCWHDDPLRFSQEAELQKEFDFADADHDGMISNMVWCDTSIMFLKYLHVIDLHVETR